jgi:hypothetical protein
LRLAICDVCSNLRARSEKLSGLVLRIDVGPCAGIAKVCSWVAIGSVLVGEDVYESDRDDIDGGIGAKASQGILVCALTLRTALGFVH